MSIKNTNYVSLDRYLILNYGNATKINIMERKHNMVM